MSAASLSSVMTSIRLATAEDAGALQAIYALYVEGTAISFEYEPPTAAEMGRRVESTIGGHPWLVCVSEGEVLGYAYASRFAGRTAYRWTVEASAYVDADQRGRGVGRALYGSLLAILTRQGFVDAYAGIALPNEASVGFHESMGFVHRTTFPDVGYKLGAWHDVGWWRRPLAERSDDPDPPLSIDEALAEPWWEEAVASGEDVLDSGAP